jgi:methionine-rich copper-binding protein CopC
MSRARWLLLVLIVGVAVGSAAPAFAHNSLTASDPEDGETLERAPDRVRLTFLAALDPDNANLAVTGPGGRSVVDGASEFDGETVRMPVRIEVAGDYQIAYEVLSSDGDWVDGSVAFTVDIPAATTPPPHSAVAIAERTDDSGSDRRALPWWGLGLAVLLGAGAGLVIYRRLRSRP